MPNGRSAACGPSTCTVLGHADRPGLPVQPHLPGRCAGAGDGAGPRVAPQGPRGAGARAVRRPTARAVGHAARDVDPDRGQRVRGADRPRPVGRSAHDPGAPRRGVRHRPSPRAARAGADPHHADRRRRPADRDLPPGRAPASPTRISDRPYDGWPAGSTCAARSPRRRRPRRRAALGGTYDVLFNGIEVERFACAEPWPTTDRRSASSAATSRARASAVLLEALTPAPARGATLGRRRRARRPVSCTRRRRATRG